MPAALPVILALGAIIVVGLLDAGLLQGGLLEGGLLEAGTAPRATFAPLYVLIVGGTAFRLGVRAGLVVAVAAVVARMGIDFAPVQPDAQTMLGWLLWLTALAAVAFFVGRGREKDATITALEGRIDELVQIEHSYARTDPLTSLCNRRAFIDALQQAEARSRRSGGALAVARLDVDHFRRLNETYSRADGDQLLRGVATSLSLTTRMGDLGARLENDEFAILLYGCGPEDAQRVGQRLVSEVAELGRTYPEARTTASVGIACFASPGPDPDEMMRLAGAALRRARHGGGNAVVVEREWTPT
jgi:diguanylate cyclase (GGDEF)-like protein